MVNLFMYPKIPSEFDVVESTPQFDIEFEKHKVDAIKKYCLENNLTISKFFTVLLFNTLLNSKFEAVTLEKINVAVPKELTQLIYAMNPDPITNRLQRGVFLRRIVTQAVNKGLKDINLLPNKDSRTKYGPGKVYKPKTDHSQDHEKAFAKRYKKPPANLKIKK